jgi:hypothetical protein
MEPHGDGQLMADQIGMLLIAYTMSVPSGEEYALDIVEYIALRMKDHETNHVHEMGVFVYANLNAAKAGSISLSDARNRLLLAATLAPLGHSVLSTALEYDPYPRQGPS